MKHGIVLPDPYEVADCSLNLDHFADIIEIQDYFDQEFQKEMIEEHKTIKSFMSAYIKQINPESFEIDIFY